MRLQLLRQPIARRMLVIKKFPLFSSSDAGEHLRMKEWHFMLFIHVEARRDSMSRAACTQVVRHFWLAAPRETRGTVSRPELERDVPGARRAAPRRGRGPLTLCKRCGRARLFLDDAIYYVLSQGMMIHMQPYPTAPLVQVRCRHNHAAYSCVPTSRASHETRETMAPHRTAGPCREPRTHGPARTPHTCARTRAAHTRSTHARIALHVHAPWCTCTHARTHTKSDFTAAGLARIAATLRPALRQYPG